MLPTKKEKPMNPEMKKVLYDKFSIVKKKTIECQGFPTKSVKNVITRDTLGKIYELFE